MKSINNQMKTHKELKKEPSWCPKKRSVRTAQKILNQVALP